MKKVTEFAVLAAIALTFGTSAFAADVKFNAYNKLSSDTVHITHVDKDHIPGATEDYEEKDFAGFTNRVYAEILTKKVDAMIKADIKIAKTQAYDNNNDKDHLDWSLNWDNIVKDWYLELRPIQMITLGFHDNVWANGSYLPIYDDNVSAGNIGSSGFSFLLRPEWDGGYVRFGATIPFTDTKKNWIYGKEDDKNENGVKFVDDETFNVGVGAIFDVELVQIGFSIQDIADNDERTFGVYVDFPTLFGINKTFDLGFGFAHSESVVGCSDLTKFGGIAGDNVSNAKFTMGFDNIAITAEMFTNFKEDNAASPYDFYTAGKVGFGLSEKATLSFTAKFMSDLSDKDDQNNYKADPVFAGAATLNFKASAHNEFEAEADIAARDGDYFLYFPVYWKYIF